jgi:hypothetical protein
MRPNKRLTSYPILSCGDDDYIDSYYDATLSTSVEFSELKIKIDILLSNDGLHELIKVKKAAYVVHFECSMLGYRQIIISKEDVVEHTIDLNDVGGVVEVSIFIVALQDIAKYYNGKFNWEFGTDGIDIDKGNILAIGPSYNVGIDRAKDALKKLSDTICIKQYVGNSKNESSISLENDVIFIYVNENIKNQYYIQGRQYLYNIISMIMVPAMSYILTQMKNNKDDLMYYRWFATIENLLKQNEVDVEQLREDESSGKNSIFALAQKIFKSPLERGIFELHNEKGGSDIVK